MRVFGGGAGYGAGGVENRAVDAIVGFIAFFGTHDLVHRISGQGA